MSPGKHSISTSRVTISKTPPCIFTPCGSPNVCTGTRTRMRTSMAMRSRSTCSSDAAQRIDLPILQHGPFFRRRRRRCTLKIVLWPRFRAQNARHLLGVHGERDRILLAAIENRRNHAGQARAARGVLAALFANLPSTVNVSIALLCRQ